MTCTYLIRLCHPGMGEFMLGTLEGDSPSDVQKRLIEFLKTNGMPEQNISYDVTDHQSVSLKGGAVLRIYPVMTSDQWAHIITALIAG